MKTCLVTARRKPQTKRQSVGDIGRLGQRGERDKENAVDEIDFLSHDGDVSGGRQCEAGFSDTADTQNGDESNGGISYQMV